MQANEINITLPEIPDEARHWSPSHFGPSESRIDAIRPVFRCTLKAAQAWPYRGRKTLIRGVCRVFSGKHVDLQTTWGARFRSAWDDTFLLQGICSEPLETFVVRSVLRPGMTVIDVGANRGWYTLLFSKLVGPAGRVIAFEPVPEMFQVLIQNMGLNTFTKNVQAHQAAASNEVGLARICINSKEPEISRLASESQEPQTNETDVDTISLDALVDLEQLETVDLVKVDVEGAELKVLAGAHDLLKKWSPILLIEAIDRNLRRYGGSSREVYSTLQRFGYRCYAIDVKHARLIELKNAGDSPTAPNWLCVPKKNNRK